MKVLYTTSILYIQGFMAMGKTIQLTLSIMIIITVSVLSGCTGTQETETDTYEYVPPATYTVTYKVDGFITASLTYSNEQGGTEQISEAKVPWMTTLYDMRSGDFVYISAQNDQEYGGVTVEIYLDDILVKSSSSHGAYVIATASGRI